MNDESEVSEPLDPKFSWHYYDEEEEMDRLIEACNVSINR
jgi:hypothetical protein